MLATLRTLSMDFIDLLYSVALLLVFIFCSRHRSLCWSSFIFCCSYRFLSAGNLWNFQSKFYIESSQVSQTFICWPSRYKRDESCTM